MQSVKTPPEKLDDSLSETVIRKTLSKVWPLPISNRICLLHADLWPGNVFFDDKFESITGVLDWEDAMLGDPLIDLAFSRLEIAWEYGFEMMEQFTQDYLKRAREVSLEINISNLPYWDLVSALRLVEWELDTFELSEEEQQEMREIHETFVSNAIDLISSRGNK